MSAYRHPRRQQVNQTGRTKEASQKVFNAVMTHRLAPVCHDGVFLATVPLTKTACA